MDFTWYLVRWETVYFIYSVYVDFSWRKKKVRSSRKLDLQTSPKIYRGRAFPGTAKGIIPLRF